jgi:aspartate racemase
MDFFKDRLAAGGLTPMIPEADDRAFINTTIFDELTKGVMLAVTRARYVAIINGLRDRGARAVIMGCTEIPLLIKPGDVDLPLFDTTAIHVAAAVNFILDRGR